MAEENLYKWTDNPTVSGVAICDTDVLNECLMHLKYENGSGDLGNKITNCLLEVPQNIKLELNNGTLTLKAGSKVIVPNGSNKFDEVLISANRTITNTSNDTYLVSVNSNGASLLLSRLKNQTGSGTSTPTSGYWTYYNTTDNKVYRINDGTVAYQLSFPIAIVTVSNGAISNIDQVFNGFGYIGSHLWVDKGVKGLIPNGRNEDGSLRNIEYTQQRVKAEHLANNSIFYIGVGLGTSQSNNYVEQEEEPTSNYTLWYKPSENKMYRKSGSGVVTENSVFVGLEVTTGNQGITSFQPKLPVRLLTEDDIKINNPYFFGQYIWSEFAPSNLSWLKSSGQWNSGSGYQGFYDWALANANAGKAGFKLSTASYTDYDFVVNTSAKTFRLPVKVQNAPMGGTAPVVGNGKVLGLTTDTGVNTGLIHTGVGGSKYLVGTSNNAYGANLSGTSGVATTDFGANGGLGVTTDHNNSGLIADLSQATNSNLSLYFYVGETVRDTALINAGQIASNFANKVEVVEAYSSGTSWYRVYSADQTGKRFCEQGGALSVGGQSVSVTLLKPYVDNTYNLTTSCNGAIDPKTVSNFVIDVNYGNSAKQGFDWRACGYIA